MKNLRALLAIVFACVLGLCAFTAVSAQTSGIFDLAVTEIETEPLSAGVGDEVRVYVTYENLLPAPIPGTVLLDLVVTVIDAETREIVQHCRQPVDLARLTWNHETQRLPFPDCPITLTEPGTHLIRAEFLEEEVEPGTGPFAMIAGDLNSTNNGRLSTMIPAVPSNDGDLPVELARIFAGLAIFFAVMALVAAGTEVLIDSVKVGVGLKRKVTSMEALERMEKYLPGELAALSVSAATREQFRRMLREMRSTLDTTLQSTSDLASMRNQIANGEFGEAFQGAMDLLPLNSELTQENLYLFKKRLFAFTNRLANGIENQLQLQPNVVQPLRDEVAQRISLFDGRNPGDFLESFFESLQDTHFWAVQIADGWLQEQESVLFNRTTTAVMSQFDAVVQPLLEGVGFSPASVDQIKRELAARLRIVETGVSQSTDTFVSSVKHVLDAVELRRFETQSPARKIWRILRSWTGGVFPPRRIRDVVGPALIISGIALYVLWLGHMVNDAGIMQYIDAYVAGLETLPWLAWLLFCFALSFILIFLLTLYRTARKTVDSPWFIGLYGSAALAILVGLFLVVVIWLLQVDAASRASGVLDLFGWVQPWWSLLVSFSIVLLTLLLLAAQVGKLIFDRLVDAAVREGRLAENRRLLDRATTLRRVETLWNLIRYGFDVTKVNPEAFGSAETVSSLENLASTGTQAPFTFSAETTAQYVMVRTDQQRDEETSRLRLLRVMSIVVGLVLAYLLQIDVLALLAEAFPGALESLNVTIVSGQTLHAWRSWLSPEKAITVGIVLTAFAASAGSAFWHDRLDKLQASKRGAQAAANLLTQASQISDTVQSRQ